jgi:hypothetical protein
MVKRACKKGYVILERQAAIKEIAGKNQWKLEFQTHLLFANKTDSNQLKGLFNYLHTPLNIPGEATLIKYIRDCPLFVIGSPYSRFLLADSRIGCIVISCD